MTSSAFADTAPFEIFCPGTPLGNLVLNDVAVTGTISPSAPTTGQQFDLTNIQTQAEVPASVVQQAEAVGLTSLTGTVSSTIDATGATPASIPTGALAFNVPIPNPIPSSGVTLDDPLPPATVGPFTATSSNVALTLDPETDITFDDGDGLGLLDLHCSAYANDSMPQSGFTTSTPPGLPISPVIALAGQATPPPSPPAVTGPYELYCPHTPVGDLVLNDVVTTASISSQSLAAGQQFSVTNYQTQIPLPSGLVSAAAGLGNSSFNGLATSAVDAYGATPDQASTGSMAFDVPIPTTVPTSGLGVDFPSSPMTVGPFTASGGPITIAQDQSTMVVAALSNKAFTMSCTAYANDSVTASGSTGVAPSGPPIRPVLAVGSASGMTTTTTTVPSSPTEPTSPTGPYELYCPGTPVGDIVLNDTVTSGTISPSTLTQGQQFQLSGLQTQFSIPQAVAEQAEGLGLTQISGDAAVFLDTSGVAGFGNQGFNDEPVPSVALSEPAEPIVIPYPDQFGDEVDMPFDVTLPNPVPASGVQFVATPTDASTTLTALGGPISIDVGDINLNVTEFGDNFGFFCTTFPNDSEPTGLAISAPEVSPIEPAIATGNATIPPPPPVGPGGVGPYELYCPGTPVGDIVLNDVTTTATLSPPDPSPGQLFNVTNYQNNVPLPASIASAAAALGNPSLSGTATATIDASGASPSSLPTGPLAFTTPLPSPIPSSGVPLIIPASPATIGMFTASSSSITIAQNADVDITLTVSGSNLNLTCTAYPDDSAPTGIADVPPDASPISPVIVTAGQPMPTTSPTTPTTTPPSGGPGAPYELYCPGTPVGNIVLNDATTTATLSPPDPTSGEQFSATNFQTEVTLPYSIVAAAAALGNSVIAGTAEVTVDATGAAPASLSSGTIAVNAPIPSPVPEGGVTLELPSPPGTVGPFTAAGGTVTLTLDPTISLALDVSGSTLNLTCHPYQNNLAATGIVASAPGGSPISPVIATTSSETGPVPTVPPTTTPTTVGTSTPTTVGTSTPTAEVVQAFNTLFDPTASLADKVGVVQDGSAVEATLGDALSSSLASSESGVSVNGVSFPDDPGCTQNGLTSPCALVNFDILGPGGNPILPNESGYAVSVDGTWLISTNTVCTLLQLYYQAAGEQGSPPGCPNVSPIPVTVTATTSVGTEGGPTTTSGPTSDSATTAAPDPASTSPTTRGDAVTGATTATSGQDPSDPTTAGPIVEASSGSLAFTGIGDVAQWLAVVGGALMILGFVLLTMVDAPRRLLYRLAHRESTRGARWTAKWLSRR